MSRDIYSTRKLNKDKRARLGRHGDTELRRIDGKASHVNALEASLIDSYGKTGEDFAKAVGAGTINPYTGLKEYHEAQNAEGLSQHVHDPNDDNRVVYYDDDTGNVIRDPHAELFAYQELLSGNYETITGQQGININPEPGQAYSGELDYGELAGFTDQERIGYLEEVFGLGTQDMKYISGFDEKPFEFLEDEYGEGGYKEREFDLQEKTLDLEQRGIDIEKRGIELEESRIGDRFDDAMYGLGAQATAQHRAVTQQGRGAMSRAGFATAGTIQSQMQADIKDLTGTYTQGARSARRDQARGLEGIGMQRDQLGIRQDQLGISRDQLGIDMDIAGTDWERAIYEEQQRQVDDFYGDVGTVMAQK